MSALDLNGTFDEILRLLACLDDPAQMREFKDEILRKRRQRHARHEAKLHSYIDAMTSKCEVVVSAYEREGAKVNKYYRCKSTGNVAVMLTKTSWNDAKGRMGTKIMMVYPDGSRSETYERTISIKQPF